MLKVVPALELIESVVELRTALTDPAESLNKLVQSVVPKLKEHLKNEHQREDVP